VEVKEMGNIRGRRQGKRPRVLGARKAINMVDFMRS